MFKKILVPLDGSTLSESALPKAKALGAKFDSEITLIRATSTPYHLADPYSISYTDVLEDIRQQNLQEVEEYLKGLKGTLRQEGYKVHAQLIENTPPATAILEVAESQQMDLIVMSTHGRGGVARWMFGSVADKVLRHSPVPILLVRSRELTLDWEPVEDNADYKHTIGSF